MNNINPSFNGPYSEGHSCSFCSGGSEKIKIFDISSTEGLPGVMLIYINKEPIASFTFSNPYINKNFEFTDKNNKLFTGKVVDGTINFTT